MIWSYRWAAPDVKTPRVSECETKIMPTVSELARDGYAVVGRDPRYPSILMRRADDETD